MVIFSTSNSNSFCKHNIHGSQICTTDDSAALPLQPLSLLALMRQSLRTEWSVQRTFCELWLVVYENGLSTNTVKNATEVQDEGGQKWIYVATAASFMVMIRPDGETKKFYSTQKCCDVHFTHPGMGSAVLHPFSCRKYITLHKPCLEIASIIAAEYIWV